MSVLPEHGISRNWRRSNELQPEFGVSKGYKNFRRSRAAICVSHFKSMPSVEAPNRKIAKKVLYNAIA